MKTLVVAPIVEGHGEVEAVPVLLRRLIPHYWPDIGIDVIRPIRQPRDRLVQNKDGCLDKSVQLAAAKLVQRQPDRSSCMILILCDADDDCARILAEGMRFVSGQYAQTLCIQISEVLAVPAFETWFAGAAESLRRFLKIENSFSANPEVAGYRKSWVETRFCGVKYSETVDQPKMTAAMDLDLCRERCSSFDKLVREIEKAVQHLR